jgi:hypothetical protein
MGAAKKVEMAPDEVFLQEALKSGKAKLVEELSMKAIGKPDLTYQARVNHIDMDHVHRLSIIHDQDAKLSPVVMFMAICGSIVRYILADGFHRHEVCRRKGLPAIRAYVVHVAMDQIEHEARMFAAMCNQIVSLPRTKDDERKAVEMLFSDAVCWEWSDSRIAKHCGIASSVTVKKYRVNYSHQRNIAMPDLVVHEGGKILSRTRVPQRVPAGGIVDPCERNIPEDLPVGSEVPVTHEGRARLKASIVDVRRTFLRFNAYCETMGNAPLSGLGQALKFSKGVIVAALFVEGDKISDAVGRAVLNREKANIGKRAFIVCDRIPTGEAALIAGKVGVEFVTHEVLFAWLDGHEGAGEGQDGEP